MTMDYSDFLRVEIHILIMHGLSEGIRLRLLLLAFIKRALLAHVCMPFVL
ncbi:MAG: hypothetical protein ACI8RD_011334 [Bacillariaceae sp.]|jgi:hypothetical protein